ncbi:MAG: hypothetical protein JW780_06065 [Clostridiales bacterium]|nr:hypothetical protein [Clostridiales bacterium]
MKRFATFLAFFLILLVHLSAQDTGKFKNEADYAEYFAKTMNIPEREFLIKTTNPKYNRHADMVSEEYAIEVDYHYKTYEAVGQALYYALMTDKKPAIVVIMEMTKPDESGKREVDEKSLSDLTEILKVAKKYEITTWTIDEEGKIEEVIKY